MSNIYWVTLLDPNLPDGTNVHYAQVEASSEDEAVELALQRNRVVDTGDRDGVPTNYTEVVGVVLDGEPLAQP